MPVQIVHSKPFTTQALRYTGDNKQECVDFTRGAFRLPANTMSTAPPLIQTQEGPIDCPIGHWVMRDPNGNFYPCSHDVFCAKYEAKGDRIASTSELDDVAREIMLHIIKLNGPSSERRLLMMTIKRSDFGRFVALVDVLLKVIEAAGMISPDVLNTVGRKPAE